MWTISAAKKEGRFRSSLEAFSVMTNWSEIRPLWWRRRILLWVVIGIEVLVALEFLGLWSDMLFDLGFRTHYVTMTERTRGSSPHGADILVNILLTGGLLAILEWSRRKLKSRLLMVERKINAGLELSSIEDADGVIEAAKAHPDAPTLIFSDLAMGVSEQELIGAWADAHGWEAYYQWPGLVLTRCGAAWVRHRTGDRLKP